MTVGPGRASVGRAPRPNSLARAHVRTCHHSLMQAFPRCAAVLRDGRACQRTVVEGSEFCAHHDQLVVEHGADTLKQGLPRRKQARSSWQPTIIAMSTDESAGSTEGSASSARRSADPSTVRPRLAAAAAESVEDIQRALLDAATSASRPAWVEFECSDCGKRKRVEVPVPDVRARVAAIELLLREGLGRPAQAEEPVSLPQLPRTEAEARALDWDQLKALAVAYPEIRPARSEAAAVVGQPLERTHRGRTGQLSRRTRRGRCDAGRPQRRLAAAYRSSRAI